MLCRLDNVKRLRNFYKLFSHYSIGTADLKNRFKHRKMFFQASKSKICKMSIKIFSSIILPRIFFPFFYLFFFHCVSTHLFLHLLTVSPIPLLPYLFYLFYSHKFCQNIQVRSEEHTSELQSQ